MKPNQTAAAIVAAKMVKNGPFDAPPKKERRFPLLAAAMGVSVLCGAAAYVLYSVGQGDTSPVVADVAGASAPAAALPDEKTELAPKVSPPSSPKPASPAGSPGPASAPLASAPAPATMPPVAPPPAEEVRRPLPSNPDTLSITAQDDSKAVLSKIFLGLDAASSTEERLRWIAEPDSNVTSLEKLFASRGGRLNIREIEDIPGTIKELPGGADVQLFRVTAPGVKQGALARLVDRDGRKVVDWTLLAQTYDFSFDRFVATNLAVPGKSEWFTTLCTLLPAAGGDRGQLQVKLTGSLAETGYAIAWTPKDSEAGHYIQKEMVPGQTYLMEVRVGTDAGKRRLLIEDCAGTQAGKSAQANANN